MSATKPKTCVITGACRGIGLGVARRLDEAGYRLALTAYDEASEKKLRHELADFKAYNHLPIPCDVSEEAQIKALFAQADEELGQLDALVVNAGIHSQGPAMDISAEVWDHLFAVNVRSVMLCCREAARRMSSHGGSIVVVGSMAAERAFPQRASYCAAKAAAHAFTECVALEWAHLGIRVNVVAPGPIDTDFINGSVQTAEAREALERKIPVGRIGTPLDVASAVQYLLSDEAAFITGTVLRIDGGRKWT